MRALAQLWTRAPRRRVIIGLFAVTLFAGAALAATAGDDDERAVSTEGAGATSTTADDDATTTSTTEATTTSTEATTTTAAPSTTASTTAAPAPPATAPADPPPAPPPPPGPFEMARVLAYAKANHRGTPPQTFTGADVCPTPVQRPRDAGDDSVRDIDEWYLARYCDGVYRGVLATTSDTPALEAAWIRIDRGPGGCQGTDRVVIGWHVPLNGGTSGRGAVIATPSCDQGSWSYVDAAAFPVFNGAWLQLDFRESAIGSPNAFDWRGHVKGVGDSVVDVVPNGGSEHFAL
jgi:hypothetical protein